MRAARHILFTLLIPVAVCAQSGTSLFRSDTVHTVEVHIAGPNWAATLMNWHDLAIDSALMASVTIDGVAMDSVGLSMRGSYSYIIYQYSPKKPFQLDFNYFNDQQRFDGLAAVNLNNNTLDPSQAHDMLCSKVLREFGLPAPRAGFADVYINDTLIGVYTLAERINKTFLGEHFDDNDGDLWKSINYDWRYLGPDEQPYDSVLSLREFADVQAHERLIDLVHRLNTTAPDHLADSLAAHLNLDEVLKTFAANVAMDAWDNAHHNWWLYLEPDSQRYHYLPWDYNLAFDIVSRSAFFEDTTTAFSYFGSPNFTGVTQLHKAVMIDPALKARYYDHLCALRRDIFTQAHLDPFLDSCYVLLRPHVENDPNDIFVVTMSDFDSAYYALNVGGFSTFWGTHAFIAEQGAIIDSVLIAKGITCGTADIPHTHDDLAVYAFPDPNDGHFTVVNDDARDHTFELVDMLGRPYASGSLRAGERTSVSVVGAASGVYLLKVPTGRMPFLQRMIIAR